MTDTVFLQFYSYISGDWPPNLEYANGRYRKFIWDYYFLGNGFSNVYENCRQNGDLVWHNYDLNGTMAEMIAKNASVPPPIQKGKLYVSAFLNVHLQHATEWAKRYPGLDIVVGGPAVRFSGFIPEIRDQLPPNVRFTNAEAEQLFGRRQTGDWHIDFPEDAQGLKFFGYTINSRCYWNKCIFCNYDAGNDIRREFDAAFVDRIPTSDFPSVVNLNIPSAPPKLLEKLPELESKSKNINYWIFVRADKNIIKTLREVLPQCRHTERFFFFMGLEFPSNRMLSFINKGFRLEDYLEVSRILRDYNCVTISALILGWNNLVEGDVDSAAAFFEKLDRVNNKRMIQINRLFVSRNGVLDTQGYFKDCPKQQVQVGDFTVGYFPLLDDGQKQLNAEIADMCYRHSFQMLRDTYSDERLWETHAG